jgi:hypothetical protein
MKTNQLVTHLVAITLLISCQERHSQPEYKAAIDDSPSSYAWPFEGDFYDTAYYDKPPVSFKAGRYLGSLLTNPGGDINGSGIYSARVTGHDSWELDFKYDSGRSTTVFIRKDGRDILVRDSASGGESRLRPR